MPVRLGKVDGESDTPPAGVRSLPQQVQAAPGDGSGQTLPDLLSMAFAAAARRPAGPRVRAPLESRNASPDLHLSFPVRWTACRSVSAILRSWAGQPKPIAGISSLLGMLLGHGPRHMEHGSRPQAFIAKFATAQTRRNVDRDGHAGLWWPTYLREARWSDQVRPGRAGRISQAARAETVQAEPIERWHEAPTRLRCHR